MNSLKIPANTEILHDIRITIDFFVHKQKIPLTPSKGWLARKILFELNGYLKSPEEGLNDRSDQYKYPRLHFLFHVLTAGKLFEKVLIKNKPFLIPNLAHIQVFRSLNDTEQFLFILRSFWLYCNWEQMQLNADMRGLQLFSVRYTLAEIPKLKANKKYVINRTMILENPLLSGVSWMQDMFIHFVYLGWFELEIAPIPDWRGRVQMESFTLTQAGKDFLTLLVTHRPFDLWNRSYRYYEEGEYGVPLGIEIDWEKVNEAKTREEAQKIIDEAKSRAEPFLKAFKPYFPKDELVNCPDFSITKPQPGVYTFKVVLAHDKKIWRRVQVNGEESLYELHKIIQESVNFDNDHLFAFYLTGDKYNSEGRFSGSPFGALDDMDGPFADDAILEELNLQIGQKILYDFDFGDSWEFEVVLENIDPEAKKLGESVIVESKGESPEQYSDWGDF